MIATEVNIAEAALTAWRENRGGQNAGVQSVLNVLVNRRNRDGSSLYEECIKKLQFSSMTAKGDPELTLYPLNGDPQMAVAVDMARQAEINELPDITGGATDYYAPAGLTTHDGQTFTKPDGTVVPFPDGWDKTKVIFTVEIADQLFFKES